MEKEESIVKLLMKVSSTSVFFYIYFNIHSLLRKTGETVKSCCLCFLSAMTEQEISNLFYLPFFEIDFFFS